MKKRKTPTLVVSPGLMAKESLPAYSSWDFTHAEAVCIGEAFLKCSGVDGGVRLAIFFKDFRLQISSIREPK